MEQLREESAAPAMVLRESLFTWRLENISAAFLAAQDDYTAPPVEGPSFEALGKLWQPLLHLNNEFADWEGDAAGLSLKLLTHDVASFSPRVTYTYPWSHPNTPPRGARAIRAVWSTAAENKNADEHGAAICDSNCAFHMLSASGVLEFGFSLSLFETEASLPPSLAVPPPSLSRDLAALLASCQLSDVTLLCGGASVPAHSAVLAARSPMFRALFTRRSAASGGGCGAEGGCAKSSPFSEVSREVSVHPSIDERTLRRVLGFVYSDELEPESAEEAQHLLNAADYLQLERLSRIAQRFLAASLSAENCAATLTLAHRIGAGGLKDAALRFFVRHAARVMQSDGWGELTSAAPELVEALAFLARCGGGER